MEDTPIILDHRGREIESVQKTKLSDILLGIFLILLIVFSISALTLLINGFISEDGEVVVVTSYTNSDELIFPQDSSNAYYRVNYSEGKKVVANGNCVDVASAILFMLKRNYEGFDKVQVAVGQDHCQAVLDKDGDKTFLGINAHDATVYEKSREFEVTQRLQQHAEYKLLIADETSVVNETHQTKAQIYYLRGEFKALEIVTELLKIKLRII